MTDSFANSKEIITETFFKYPLVQIHLHGLSRNSPMLTKVIFQMTKTSLDIIRVSSGVRVFESSGMINGRVGRVSVEGPVWPKFIRVDV